MYWGALGEEEEEEEKEDWQQLLAQVPKKKKKKKPAQCIKPNGADKHTHTGDVHFFLPCEKSVLFSGTCYCFAL